MSDITATPITRRRHRHTGLSRWLRLSRCRPGRGRPLRVVSVRLGAEELVVVEGRLAGAVAPRMQAVLDAAAGCAYLVVDLRRVCSIDRDGARAVIAAGADHPAIVLVPVRRRARRRLERAATAAGVELRREPIAG